MLLIVLCATSCRTKKRTAQSSSTTVAAARIDSVRAASVSSCSAATEETSVEFSAPDSAGRTYVTRIVRRKAVVASGTAREVTAVRADSARTTVSTERTTEKTGARAWSKAVVIIGSVLAAIAVALAMIWKIKH